MIFFFKKNMSENILLQNEHAVKVLIFFIFCNYLAKYVGLLKDTPRQKKIMVQMRYLSKSSVTLTFKHQTWVLLIKQMCTQRLDSTSTFLYRQKHKHFNK